MPNVWAGTTVDGVQCRLNSDPTGLVAFVGKGGKKTMTKVATRSTSLTECIANMAQVIDRGREPRPMPADLYTLLSELPLLAGNASKAVRANDCQGGPRRVCPWQGLGLRHFLGFRREFLCCDRCHLASITAQKLPTKTEEVAPGSALHSGCPRLRGPPRVPQQHEPPASGRRPASSRTYHSRRRTARRTTRRRRALRKRLIKSLPRSRCGCQHQRSSRQPMSPRLRD